MIIRTLDDVKASGGFGQKAGAWSSARYLLKPDELGFTMTMTTVVAGNELELEYKNHVEANLIIEGRLLLNDISGGIERELGPGDMYALDKHDRHRLKALTDVTLVCVFTPALTGSETHDADGSYPAAT